jgi:hypothetical protein
MSATPTPTPTTTTVSNPYNLGKYDVKIYYSSHEAGNALYLGGPRSNQELSDNYLHNFFQKTTEAEQISGITKYRCGYIVNTSSTVYVKNPILFIIQNTSSPNDSVAVGWGYAAIGTGFPDGLFDLSVEPFIDSENNEPRSVDFFDGNTPSSGAILGQDIPPGQAKSFWIQYTSNFNAQAFPRNTFVLQLHADNLPHNATINTTGTLAQIVFPIMAEGASNTAFTTMANNMLALKPDFIATAGNNNVNSNPSFFINAFSSYMPKMLLTFGDRDVKDTTVINAYVNELAKYNFAANMSNRYYSKDYGNVHILVMDTSGATPYTNPSDQYTFVFNDLKNAFTNPVIDWIIVITNRAMYGSQTTSAIRFLYSDLRDTYHQLFTDFGVVAVIQGTYHFYERSKVLGYNKDTPSNPTTFAYNGPQNYTIQGKKSFMDGSIFLTIGTGGVLSDTISLLAPYSQKNDQNDTGYLYVKVNNATSDRYINFRYYTTSRSTVVFVDNFTITRLG